MSSSLSITHTKMVVDNEDISTIQGDEHAVTPDCAGIQTEELILLICLFPIPDPRICVYSRIGGFLNEILDIIKRVCFSFYDTEPFKLQSKIPTITAINPSYFLFYQNRDIKDIVTDQVVIIRSYFRENF